MRQMEETLQPLRPYDPMDTLKQFLDHDRHVLRFYCYWDDRDEMFGDVRHMILHYYLADDTIEVLQRLAFNFLSQALRGRSRAECLGRLNTPRINAVQLNS